MYNTNTIYKNNSIVNNPRFIVYPGLRVGENQNYTLTWEYQTVFVTHREDVDEIIFNTAVDENDKIEIEWLLRQYLFKISEENTEKGLTNGN